MKGSTCPMSCIPLLGVYSAVHAEKGVIDSNIILSRYIRHWN